MRHKFLEWIVKNKRATFNSTFRPFQSVELSLHRLLPSRADVCYPQLNKVKQLTQFIEQTQLRTDLPEIWSGTSVHCTRLPQLWSGADVFYLKTLVNLFRCECTLLTDLDQL